MPNSPTTLSTPQTSRRQKRKPDASIATPLKFDTSFQKINIPPVLKKPLAMGSALSQPVSKTPAETKSTNTNSPKRPLLLAMPSTALLFEAPSLSLLHAQNAPKPKQENQIFGVPQATDKHDNRIPWKVGVLGVPAPSIAQRALTAPLANPQANSEFNIKPGVYNNQPQRRELSGFEQADKDLAKLDEDNISAPDSALFSKDGKDYNGAVTIQNTASHTARYINAHLRGYVETGTSIIWKQTGPDNQTGVMKVYAHASREIDKTEGLKKHLLNRGMQAHIFRYGLTYQESLGSTSALPGTKSWIDIPLKIAGLLKNVKLADDKNIFIGKEFQRLDFERAQGAKYTYGNIWTLLGAGGSAARLTGNQSLGLKTFQIPHYQRWAYSPFAFWSGAGAPLDRATYFRPLHMGIDRGQKTDKYQFYAVTDLEHMGALSLYEGSASVDYRDMRILRNGSAVNIADKATKNIYLQQAGLNPDGKNPDGTLNTDGGLLPQMASGGASHIALDVPRSLADAATPDNSITEIRNGLEITRDKNDPAKIIKIVEKSSVPSWLRWLGGSDDTYVPVSSVTAYIQNKAATAPDKFGGFERIDHDSLKAANFNNMPFFGGKESRAKTFEIDNQGTPQTVEAFNVNDTINTGFGTVAGHDGIFKFTNLHDNDIKAQAIFAHYTQQSLKNFAAYVDPGSVRADGSVDYKPALFNFAKDSAYWLLRTRLLTKHITLPNIAIKAVNENIVRGGTIPASVLDYVNPLSRYTPEQRGVMADTINTYNPLDNAERAIDKGFYAFGGWAADGLTTRLGHYNKRSTGLDEIAQQQIHAADIYAQYKDGQITRDDAQKTIEQSQAAINTISDRIIGLETPKYRDTMWRSLPQEQQAASTQTPVPTETTTPATPTDKPVQDSTTVPVTPPKPAPIKLIFRKGDYPQKLQNSLQRNKQDSDFSANLKSLSLNDRKIKIGQEVDVLAADKVDTAQAPQRMIRLRRGDTPLGLAAEFYKDRKMAERILELNKDRLVKARNGQSYLRADSFILLPASDK